MGGLEQDKVEYETRIARENKKVVDEEMILITNEDGSINLLMMVGHKNKTLDNDEASTSYVLNSIVRYVIESDEWTVEFMLEELKDWGFVARVIQARSVQKFKLDN